MNKEKAQDAIAGHREKIDALDAQIVSLLNQRAQHALAIRSLKPQAQCALYDPKREQEILDELCRNNQGPLYAQNIQEIYRAILKVMKEVPLS